MKYKPIQIGKKEIEETNLNRGYKVEGNIEIDNTALNNVKRLNTLEFPKYPSVLLVSQRRAGKSTALRSILKEHGAQYDEIYIISQTARFNDDYYFVEKEHIFPAQLIDVIIPAILKQAEEDIIKKKKVERLIILDDVMGYIRNNDEVSGLFTRGRHFKITTFLIVQRISAVRPEIRNNSDIILSALSKSKEVQEFFIEEFLSANFDKKTAYDIFKKITNQPFHFIVAENFRQTINPEEFIKYYYTEEEKPILDFIYRDKNQTLNNKTMLLNNSNIINKKIKISNDNINDGSIRKRGRKGATIKNGSQSKGGIREISVSIKRQAKIPKLKEIKY
jgi:hypothetical protein